MYKGLIKKSAILTEFGRNTSGQFAVMFALLAFPIIIALAYVSDMTYAGKVKAELKGSLDAAALAAVINQNLTESERAAFAEAHFKENFEFSDLFKVDVVNASAKRVELKAEGGFPSYIGAMTGRDTFDISTHAASILTTEDVICILALDEKSEGAFTMSKEATLFGDQCSVQVNSTHTNAAIVESYSMATAKSFCVAGGARGSFSPYVNTECSQIEDPYKSVAAPPLQACLLESLVGNVTNPGNGGTGLGGAGHLMTALENANVPGNGTKKKLENVISILDNVTLTPGTYCSTVVISGENVRLMPGTYVFQNSLIITNESSVSGEGVTLSFNGQDSHIEIMNGSQVYLKAPGQGQMDQNGSTTYAGLAIFQNSQGQGAISDSNSSTSVSYLRGGSGMAIVGTVYLPSQRLYIGRDSTSDVVNQSTAESPATSFIAHQVHLEGSDIRVAVNHQVAGLPAILPRSDEGARLVE